MKRRKDLKKALKMTSMAILFVASVAFVVTVYDLTGMRIGYAGFAPAIGSAIGFVESL